MGNIHLSEEYSRDELLVKELKASGLPLFLYGIGLIADTAQVYLSENGLQPAGRVIDDKYVKDLPSGPEEHLL